MFTVRVCAFQLKKSIKIRTLHLTQSSYDKQTHFSAQRQRRTCNFCFTDNFFLLERTFSTFSMFYCSRNDETMASASPTSHVVVSEQTDMPSIQTNRFFSIFALLYTRIPPISTNSPSLFCSSAKLAASVLK